MTWFVLDASTALAWCFPDENNSVADYVADTFKNGGVANVTPFWSHEILNALLVGEKRKRISEALIQVFLDDLAKLPIVVDKSQSINGVFTRIQTFCREHGLTTYDAAYLELAIRNELPLATLDKALQKAAKAAGVALLQP
ncbi:MAG: type II toxin-antitoxin system VapC family toxin [Methylomonas sp.]|jgi:predicted nucleic acid-binding protein